MGGGGLLTGSRKSRLTPANVKQEVCLQAAIDILLFSLRKVTNLNKKYTSSSTAADTSVRITPPPHPPGAAWSGPTCCSWHGFEAPEAEICCPQCRRCATRARRFVHRAAHHPKRLKLSKKCYISKRSWPALRSLFVSVRGQCQGAPRQERRECMRR